MVPSVCVCVRVREKLLCGQGGQGVEVAGSFQVQRKHEWGHTVKVSPVGSGSQDPGTVSEKWNCFKIVWNNERWREFLRFRPSQGLGVGTRPAVCSGRSRLAWSVNALTYQRAQALNG